MKLGILGYSEGNGHPFSFSSIINGYSDAGYAEANWPVIHDYLKVRDKSEFGFPGVQVTHAWAQDPAITKNICAASLVPNAVDRPEAMIGQVDAVIIARDDYETHLKFALPFLQAGLPVFVDKPLAVKEEELKIFRPYAESGQLFSCAGMRFAKELDEARSSFAEYGKIRLIRAAVISSWEKYGIHMIDSVLGLTNARPHSVLATEQGEVFSARVQMSDDSLLEISALGKVPKTFHLEIYGEKKSSGHDMADNFSMFRRTLAQFIRQVQEKKPVLPPEDLWAGMKLLIAARRSASEKRWVSLDEVRF